MIGPLKSDIYDEEDSDYIEDDEYIMTACNDFTLSHYTEELLKEKENKSVE